MLQTATVNKHTLELLKKVCCHQQFNNFFLVGGTALSLQIGHRISIDLDFFTLTDFDENKLKDILIKEFDAQIFSIDNNAITGLIDRVKFDFIAHQYPLLEPILEIEKTRLSSLEDIAAMKLNAVRNRGTKKDFVDIYFLLQKFNLEELLEMVNSKYPNHVDILTLKSLVYFDDAENQPDCEMLIDIDWKKVKQKIEKETIKFL
jgi:predicted nucleotidyltransferase component of viral defense system